MDRKASVDGVTVAVEPEGSAAGVVLGRGCLVGPSPEALDRDLRAAIEAAKTRTEIEHVTAKIRDMLRHGKYKPTGRGKPASEYLFRAACEDRFPRINNLVDINNLISLRSMLPISLVDLTRAESARFVVRHGRAGESYVFNTAGQMIDLEDLLLVAALPADVPCANPVKDSMRTKLVDGSSDVMAVLYAPRGLLGLLEEATEHFAHALADWGGATKTSSVVVS